MRDPFGVGHKPALILGVTIKEMTMGSMIVFVIAFLVGLIYQIVKAVLVLVFRALKAIFRAVWRLFSRHTQKEMNP